MAEDRVDRQIPAQNDPVQRPGRARYAGAGARGGLVVPRTRWTPADGRQVMLIERLTASAGRRHGASPHGQRADAAGLARAGFAGLQLCGDRGRDERARRERPDRRRSQGAVCAHVPTSSSPTTTTTCATTPFSLRCERRRLAAQPAVRRSPEAAGGAGAPVAPVDWTAGAAGTAGQCDGRRGPVGLLPPDAARIVDRVVRRAQLA